MKYKVGYIYDPIYDVNIYYIPKSNVNVLKDFISRRYNHNYDCERPLYDGKTIACPSKDKFDYIIAMANMNKTPLRLAQLAHECLHVALYVLDEHGVKYDGDNSEQLNYYHQWLFQQCLECKSSRSIRYNL